MIPLRVRWDLLVIRFMRYFSEVLLTIKSRLDDPKPSIRPNLTEDLHRAASLAEAFTDQRSKSNKSTSMQFADSLDQEGAVIATRQISIMS